jgi:hypothetical protein
MSGMSEDQVATLLRDALRREGGTMQPSADGLRRIRQDTAARGRRRPELPRRSLLAAAAGVMLGGGATGGAVLAGRRPDDRGDQPELMPSTTTPPPGGPWRIVTTYMVRMVDGHPRPVPERRRAPQFDMEGLGVLTQTPVGPDLGTYWTQPFVAAIGGTRQDPLIVEMRRDAFGSSDVNSEEEARVAIQQIIWTLTENMSPGNPERDGPVTFLVESKRGYRAWNLITLGAPMARDPSLLA